MPYFVYDIAINADTGAKRLTHLETFEGYKEARGFARERRAERGAAPDMDCRMIFAKNKVEAEKLLSAPREERVIGED